MKICRLSFVKKVQGILSDLPVNGNTFLHFPWHFVMSPWL